MNRSKLQICTEILVQLASNGPMNLNKLCERVNLNETHLQQRLKLLTNSSLVSKEVFGKNQVFFAVTDSGLAVLKMFRHLIEETYETRIIDFKAIAIPL